MSKDYERWKLGKKIFKAPQIIRYWESITDENQYELGQICRKIQVRFIGIACLTIGIFLGVWISSIL